MALMTTRRSTQLVAPFVLAPERYDPRRESLLSESTDSAKLGTIAALSRDTVAPGDSRYARCLVLDTSHSSKGFVTRPSTVTSSAVIGSNKKLVRAGDVIISRLRPYLRQVGWIDPGLASDVDGVLCSTEYFVLRPTNDSSITFLVPYLLTDAVQQVLAAAQEGGHHPRFNEQTLLDLPVPRDLLEQREDIGRLIRTAITGIRQAVREIEAAVNTVSSLTARANTMHAIN